MHRLAIRQQSVVLGSASQQERVAVANAGSYSVADIASPIAAHTRYSWGKLVTPDHATTSSVPAIEPTVINSRGPFRSSQRPTGIAASPASSSPSEKAPVMSPRDQPCSASIGARYTVKA